MFNIEEKISGLTTFQQKEDIKLSDVKFSFEMSEPFTPPPVSFGLQGPQGVSGTNGTNGRDGVQGFQGRQGITGPTGLQGFQGFQGNTGSTGVQGFQGDTGPSSIPVGENNSIQYKSDSSLSSSSFSKIISDLSLVPSGGYSGNFVYYTESITSQVYSSVITSNTTINIPFGTCNVFTVDDIKLNSASIVLTITGFSNMVTGQSMTLILGHTGVNGSRIEFPQSHGIWWSGGVIGGVGSTSTIYPGNQKRYDVIAFFDDGYRIFGNYSLNYRQ